MPRIHEITVDVLVFGGGAAGLWTLDALVRSGRSALLLESARLGQGQTLCSQGILHGGLKYTLRGLFSAAADAIRDMPALWRECLAGARTPNLTTTTVLSPCCYLWRTGALASRAGMLGARAMLRVQPERLAPAERPGALHGVPGEVFRLAEPVIDPASLVGALAAAHAGRIASYSWTAGIDVQRTGSGSVAAVAVRAHAGGDALRAACGAIVLTAGAGNAALMERLAGAEAGMQRRPLHMTMARGELPELFGHCTDFSSTRVTITSGTDRAGRRVWQIGGQLAEDGVKMEPEALLERARAELASVLPGVSLRGVEWATYRIDRAEARTADGARPDDAACAARGNVICGWPTKLALTPRLVQRVLEAIEALPGGGRAAGARADASLPTDWPRPTPADPPWEGDVSWKRVG